MLSLCERGQGKAKGLELPSLALSSHKCVMLWMRALGDTEMTKIQFQLSRNIQCGTVEETGEDNYNTGKKCHRGEGRWGAAKDSGEGELSSKWGMCT